MRSHLVAFLIAGLILLPAVRVFPVGMPVGELEAMCPTCQRTEAGDASSSCCAADDEAPEDEQSCNDCPPVCCLMGPAIAIAAPQHSDDHFAARPRAQVDRPGDERADSRTLAPDPPVPIA